MSQAPSVQQKTLIRQIKEQQQQINEIFKQLDIRKSDIIKEQNSDTAASPSSTALSSKPAYLNKYNDYQIDKIRKNYEEAILPFKWYQLPYCRKTILDKAFFFCPANLVLLTTYIFWKKISDQTAKFPLARCFKMYAAMGLVSSVAVFVESLLTEPYCDINSRHYNKQLSNIELARQLKKQYQQYYKKKQ